MAIKVTQNWSGMGLSLKPPWEADLEFEVSGTSSALAATTAVDAVTSLKLPQRGDAFSTDFPSLICEGPVLKGRKGPLSWTFGCHYATNSYTAAAGDLNRPKMVRWETVEASLPVDVDLDGNTIMNPAGVLYPPSSRVFTYKRLYVTRWEPFYDVGKSTAYENSTNQAAMTLAGRPVAAEHCRCCTILPLVEYNPDNIIALPIGYVFDVFFDDVLGLYPFQHKFLCKSASGWALDPVSSKYFATKFVDANQNPLEREVRIGSGGLPHPTETAAGVQVYVATSSGVDTPWAFPLTYSYYKYEADLAHCDKVYFKKTRLTNLAALGL